MALDEVGATPDLGKLTEFIHGIKDGKCFAISADYHLSSAPEPHLMAARAPLDQEKTSCVAPCATSVA